MFLFRHIPVWVRATLGNPAARLAYGMRLAEAGKDRAAVRQFLAAARAGVPQAAYRLGRCYLMGLGVPANLETAWHWLTQAAAADIAEALALLASLAMQGITDPAGTGLFAHDGWQPGRPPDHAAALHWAERAAALGSADGHAVLGLLLTAGPATMHDPARGATCYRHAAEGGSAQGKLGWAVILLQDPSADQDHARTLLREAAASGLAAAHYVLGVLDDTAGDSREAAARYRAAAELGHHGAQLRYGAALLDGRGLPRDPQAGETWLRRAALGGETTAAAMVGDLYARVGPLPPNYCEAGMWFQRAAEAGHVGAARALGQLYLRGDGFGADPEIAVHWLQVAAAGGDAVAAYDLGLCLAQGLGAARDDAAALRWLRQAAEAIPAAQYWYARLLAEGRGGEVAPAELRAWYLRAAAAGNGDAAVAAAEMLWNGRGGPADPAAALDLFSQAAAKGHPGAAHALAILAPSQPAAHDPAAT